MKEKCFRRRGDEADQRGYAGHPGGGEVRGVRGHHPGPSHHHRELQAGRDSGGEIFL